MANSYSFQSKVVSFQCYVFKETICADTSTGDRIVLEVKTNQTSVNIDPYSCVIPLLSYIYGDKFQDLFIFHKRWGWVNWGVYQPSPIPSGDLIIPLLLTFMRKRYTIFTEMKNFVLKLCDYFCNIWERRYWILGELSL